MPGAHYVVDAEHAGLGAFFLLLSLNRGDVADDGFVVSERISKFVDNLTGGLFFGPLDFDLIVALICLIVRSNPVIYVQFLLARSLRINELLLDPTTCICQGIVHLPDILYAVKLLGRCLLEVLWEFRI